jgi:ABC-type transport system substrate-binding protein
MRKWWIWGTVVAVLVGLGVSGAGWPAPATRVLRVAEATDVVTLDPAFAADRPSHSVIGHIYERLMRYEYDPRSGGIRPVPELLRRLEVSADGRTWTFWIQPGRVFSDGNPVDAVAVKYSLERILAPAIGSPYRPLLEPVQRIEVGGPDQLRIFTREPYSSLGENLAAYQTAVVSPRAAGRLPLREFGRRPVGSGPYVLDEWLPGQQVVLARNPEFSGRRPWADRIVFRPIPEAAARVVALEAGDVDVAMRVPAEAVRRLEGRAEFEVLRVPTTFQISFEFNHRRKPFDDPRVRRALNLAVDRRAIVERVLLGAGKVPTGPAPEGVTYRVALGEYRYDPEEARRLLAEAGYPQGFSTVLWTPAARYGKDREVAQAVQAYLGDVGVRAEIRVWEWGAYVSAIARPEKEAGLYLLGVSIPTADWRFYRNFRSDAPTNYSGYRSPEVDRLLDEARATTQEARKQELYARVQRVLWSDAPYLFLYDQVLLVGVRRGVSGVKVLPIETVELHAARAQ